MKTSLLKKEKESNNLTEENASLKESLSKLKNYNEEEIAKKEDEEVIDLDEKNDQEQVKSSMNEIKNWLK